MKTFALYLIATIGTDDPDGGVNHVWTLDGGFETMAECVDALEVHAPHFALMGPATYLECDVDHAPEMWGYAESDIGEALTIENTESE